tara:strand:- start:729 stop:917 length:189 start_codon:yes stop_codon:yes gene_type:complete
MEHHYKDGWKNPAMYKNTEWYFDVTSRRLSALGGRLHAAGFDKEEMQAIAKILFINKEKKKV